MDRSARWSPLVGLLLANVVSVLGGAMSMIALPWFVFETTGSAALTGIAAVCETVPVVAVSLVAGTIVARVGARATRVWSDVIAGSAVLAVPILHATIGIAYWQLLALAAVNGALRTPAVAASMVLLRDATASAGLTPQQTTGPYSASVRLAATLGAPVAGLLIALVGAPAVLVVDAVTFVISAAIVRLLLPPDPRITVPADRRRHALADLAHGLRLLRADRVLALLVGLSIVEAAMAAGWNGVAAPIYGQLVLADPLALGVLLGAFGVGGVVGNLTFGVMSRHVSRFVLLAAALVLGGPVLWGSLAAELPIPVLSAVLLVAGGAFGLLSPLFLAMQYARVPPDDQGQLFGLTFGLQTAGQAMGAALAGFALSVLSLTVTLTLMAALTAAVAVAALPTRSMRELRRREG